MYYIIVNPAAQSGRGAHIWQELQPLLDRKRIVYSVFFSKKAGHVISWVRSLCEQVLSKEAILKLIVLGGDGTLNETLQGITDFDRVYVGYIPAGSSNDMARGLRLSPKPAAILERILACQTPTAIDLGLLHNGEVSAQLSRLHGEQLLRDRYFAVSAGIGFDAAVCEEALSSKSKNILNRLALGKLTYLIIALKQLIGAPRTSCVLTLEDGTHIALSRFLFVAGMIHPYEGGGFMFCPNADDRDGLLDLCVAGDFPKLMAPVILPFAFKGKHYRFRGIDGYRTASLHLHTSEPLWVHTDGEVTCKSTDITICCAKETLKLML